MNVYFDLDDTLVRSFDNTKINTGSRLLSVAMNMGLKPFVLTFSSRDRALGIVEKHYPNTFVKVIAKEDFCNVVEQTEYFSGIKVRKLEALCQQVDPDGILVDDLQPIHDIVLAKMKYLGLTKDRYFWFNVYDHRSPQKFMEMIIKLKQGVTNENGNSQPNS
jgi:hypothetical protein